MFIKHRLGRRIAVALMSLLLIPAATDFSAQGQGRDKGEIAKSEEASARESMTPIPGAILRQSKPNMYLPDCTRPKDHDQADLCEQMRMADAAKKAEGIAYQQYVVSLWGLAALIVTLGLSVLATRAATRAARAAERALTDLERPHVFVDVVKPGITVAPVPGKGVRFSQKGHIVYQVVNYGRTPARLLDITRQFPVARRPSFLPDPVPQDEAPRILPAGIVAVADHPYRENENLRAFYGSVLLEDNAPLDVQLFFMGRVRYADIFENIYVVGFCFVFDPNWGRYVRVGDERYNYTHKQPKT